MTASALPADPTILRAVAPPEAPYRGVLAAGDPVRYLVASNDAPDGVWAAGDDHVLGALDLDRIDDRIVLVLPRLLTRVSRGTFATVRAGQAVTLVVSMLRGGLRADELGIECGDWWLTDDGRPVLAPGGDRAWRETACDLLDDVGRAPGAPAWLERVSTTIATSEGYARAVDALEDELFAAVEPEALDPGVPRGDAHGSDEWRALVAGGESSQRDHRDPVQREVTDAVTRLVDADIGRQVAEAWQSVRRRLAGRRDARPRRVAEPAPSRTGPRSTSKDAGGPSSSPRPSRRPVLLLGAAVIAATLAVGLGWPTDDADGPVAAEGLDAAQSEGSESPGTTADGAVQASDADDAGEDTTTSAAPPAPSDAATTTPNEALIDALATCIAGGDDECRSTVLERQDAHIPPGIATTPGPRTVIELDDLGGVLVTRVEDPAGAQPAQIVVLVDTDEKRLVRDVYDVADQP